MKHFILFLCLLMVVKNTFSQDTYQKDLIRLQLLGTPSTSVDSISTEYNNELRKIVRLDKKRKKQKALGFVLSSAGLLFSSFGTFLLIKASKSDDEFAVYPRVFGGLSLGVGVVSGGISVPLFVSAKKKKRKAMQLIESLQKKRTEIDGITSVNEFESAGGFPRWNGH